MSSPQLPILDLSTDEAQKSLSVFGFRSWSNKLTFRMKRQIREFVKANPRAISISCQGFSHITTLADRGMATERGEAVRLYIQKLNPEMHTKTLTGAPLQQLDESPDHVVLTAR